MKNLREQESPVSWAHRFVEKILADADWEHIDIRPEEYLALYNVDERSYGNINPKLLNAEASINNISARLGYLFNQYLVASLLEDFDPAASSFSLPQSIVSLYQQDLLRIETQFDQFEPCFYQLNNDAFLKDLAILRHRLLPVGAEYAHPKSGVPRSVLFKGGVKQFFRGIWVCVFQSGGFRPFVELHAHSLALDAFNPIGWDQTYRHLAEFLEANPSIRGVTSSSWFLDPELKRISPHLCYLREQSETSGATILFSSYDVSGSSGALSKSTSRRRLFSNGDYTPAIYTRVWPRNKLIKWRRQLSSPA